MAHSRSAKKRIRQNLKARVRNKAVKTHLKTRVKKFEAAVTAGDVTEARKQGLLLQRSFDKASTHGVVHPKMAARKKSRATLKLNALAQKGAGG
ncbi:MAG TPA: 30S ribosomal protein S20 [Planctomycetota bacterium]|nr:30S ribosomal protein S20 [Planctomycetota bacterium]